MFTTSKIAKIINGKINGDPNITIKGVCDIKNGTEDYISYLISNNKQLFDKSKSKVIIVNMDFNIERRDKTLIKVRKPALSFIDVVNLFHPKEKLPASIHNSAEISSCASIGKNVNISSFVNINKNVTIGDNVIIGSGTYIGENTQIGDNCTIFPNNTIYNGIIIGQKCIIDSGTVIGSDGFGLVTDNNITHKIPHIGGVIIGDNVSIGSNCCIDRGTLGNTIIGNGSKLDNLIHIAHNVSIGKNCIIAAQVGIAGSTIVEDNVTLAGQVGVADHVIIGENSTVAAKSAIFQSIPPHSFTSGIPARNHKERIKQDVIIKQLPDLLKRIRKLEK